MNSHTRKSYSLAFKIQAVERYLENGMNLKATAEELEVHPATMKHWIRKGKEELKGQLGTVSNTDKNLIKKLEAEVERLTEDNLVLKKAARLFAAQS